MFIRSPRELAVYFIDRRKQLGLTQQAVAERMGLLQKTISAFENNPEKTRLETLFRILAAIQVEMRLNPKDLDQTIKAGWQEKW